MSERRTRSLCKTLCSAPKRLYQEAGLSSLYSSSLDVKILCFQRFVRQFAYGQSTLILVPFFNELGVSQAKIGLFMTLTLAGDILISLFLTIFADGIGRRLTLACGAALMIGSGIAFGLAENYWILLAAAILGVISPSGNEVGPFRALEESSLAHLTDAQQRTHIYAWYSLIGTSGAAIGILSCGWVIQHLHHDREWSYLAAYRLIFHVYAGVGALKLLLAFLQSRAVEADKPEAETTEPAAAQASNSETEPLLRSEDRTERDTEAASLPQPKKPWLGKGLVPQISPQSRATLLILCLLFALDSFASGLAPMSWVTYYFRLHFGVEDGQLGSIFFTTSIIAAFSSIVAASLARRFGNVKTMVFTHMPSAVFLALIPFPSDVRISTLFLILRSCTQSMDVAPRSAFLAAIVLPQERTAVLGVVNFVKTLAQSLGPLITGILSGSSLFWVSFVCAGSLKVCYDLGMLALFKSHK